MKILHLASEYPPQRVFGLGRYVRDLAEEQARQNHAVTVLTNSVGGALFETIQEGVKVLRVCHPPPPQPLHTSACVTVFNILLLRRAISIGVNELQKFDIICSHDWLTAPAGQALHHALGIPHISTFHDTAIGKRMGLIKTEVDRFTVDIERWAVNNVTHVIANSKSTRDELVNSYGAKPSRLTVVPCAIAPATFSTISDDIRLAAFRQTFVAPDELLILYVGRLDPEKGVDILLTAFAKLNLPKAKICIAGIGSLADPLRAKACELGIEKNVLFLGYVESPALSYLYECSDFIVCPSLYEPYGMVALEGMLKGKPAVVSDTGGLAELVNHNETGLIIPPGDVEALAAALKRLADNPDDRVRMGKTARQRVLDARTWPKVCHDILKIYDSHLASRPVSINKSESHLLITSSIANPETSVRGAIGSKSATSLAAPGGVTRQMLPDVEHLPIRGVDRHDDQILNAFRLAAELISYASDPPHFITCTDWVGVLAAQVLFETMRRPHYRYFVPNTHPCGADSAPSQFVQQMKLWAVNQIGEVIAPDRHTKELIKNTSDIQNSNVLSKFYFHGQVANRDIFRNTICANHKYIVAVMGCSKKESDWFNKLILLVENTACAKLPIEWLVVDRIEERHEKWIISQKNNLPVQCSGQMENKTLRAILSVSDAALTFSDDSKFISVCNESAVPLFAPLQSFFATTVSLHVNFDDVRSALEKIAITLQLPNATRILPDFHMPKRRNQIPNASPAKNLILFNNWGFGDELLLSSVARELKRVHPEIQIQIRSRFGFNFRSYCSSQFSIESAISVETIYQNPVLFGPTNHAPFPGHLVQQMLDKVALDTGIRATAKDFRPEVTLRKHSSRQERTIALHCRPNPRLPSKDWGLSRWQQLCHLLSKKDIAIIQLGGPDEPLLDHVQDARSVPVSDVPEVIAEATMVVCLVGFLMHVAAATNTPALVIYGGREHPAIDGYTDHIHIGTNPLDCRGRWGCHLGADMECPHGMKCMDEITPELIAELIEDALLIRTTAASI